MSDCGNSVRPADEFCPNAERFKTGVNSFESCGDSNGHIAGEIRIIVPSPGSYSR